MTKGAKLRGSTKKGQCQNKLDSIDREDDIISMIPSGTVISVVRVLPRQICPKAICMNCMPSQNNRKSVAEDLARKRHGIAAENTASVENHRDVECHDVGTKHRCSQGGFESGQTMMILESVSQ